MDERIRVHLDTDIGGDADDLCALALLLGSPEVDLVGVTTSADRDGLRAAFVGHALRLAGRTGVPVASGAFGFLGGFPHTPGIEDAGYWPDLEPVAPTVGGTAIELLTESAVAGATIIAIGPYTNLAIVQALRPGAFDRARVVVMGGYVRPPGPGLPQWGARMDYNVQADRVAARMVFERLDPLVVPLGLTLEVWLRESNLPALEGGGPLAGLIARQGRLHRRDSGMDVLAREHAGLPDDLLNFQYDPLACAAALGWRCIETSRLRLRLAEHDGWLAFEEGADAPERSVVTRVDAEEFSREWLTRVVRA
jgi:purine nucleosidase